MKDLFNRFDGLNILIIGDVMMDSYLWGSVERISPEAPVPVISVKKKENRLGGAANVALNVQSLGATPLICSVIGTDSEGDSFLQLMEAQGLSSEGLIRLDSRPTTVKTRVIGHNQQMLRIDAETDDALMVPETQTLLSKVLEIMNKQKIDAIIFEDYDKGAITEELISSVVSEAKRRNIITVVDPKKRNFLSYKGVTLFKPNLKELREGLKVDVNTAKAGDLEKAAVNLREQLNSRMIMVTLSELGVFIMSENGQRIIPAHIRKIADVSGAGDTVIATASLCLAAGLDEFKTAAIANLAGGLVCEHVGVVSISKERLLKELDKAF
ncbi:rfaE bifunctional protein kinase chain/domain [Arcticibacter tournemirensis]|uniref:D-glycero-beta-D-manno-heptose-7-phosphate kinase n=1 Tax=Arcticibacter tournemirensis TaxID=699437 RepID=A0A5M9H9P7_9SPHI|nr:bifunctional ADP-heptose synthase [Arcticibacter tournemirensis]KAA8483643.1 D-glycero-beta-D-manno-heptose-7-phosphate kinase [Arcticibacter tournemirensis]TQM51402.1 rfaE bifunctional protein kinase chain/domain [Arcticibacter tournemirensis]